VFPKKIPKFFITSAWKFRRRIMERQLLLLLLDSGEMV
jgi:hypothetical protein